MSKKEKDSNGKKSSFGMYSGAVSGKILKKTSGKKGEWCIFDVDFDEIKNGDSDWMGYSASGSFRMNEAQSKIAIKAIKKDGYFEFEKGVVTLSFYKSQPQVQLYIPENVGE